MVNTKVTLCGITLDQVHGIIIGIRHKLNKHSTGCTAGIIGIHQNTK